MTTSRSGFLSSYAELTPSLDGSSASTRSAATIDPTRVTIGAIEWRTVQGADINEDERSALLSHLRDELMARLQELPAVPGGRPVVLRAAITRIETVSPALNAVSALLYIVPLDRGGASVDIEVLDASNGKQGVRGRSNARRFPDDRPWRGAVASACRVGAARQRSIANDIHKFLSGHGVSVRDWEMNFSPDPTILEELSQAARSCLGAVMLLTKDDELVGSTSVAAPRDNVIFEMGMFMEAKGRERVLVVCDVVRANDTRTRVMAREVLSLAFEVPQQSLANAFDAAVAESSSSIETFVAPALVPHLLRRLPSSASAHRPA